MAQDITNIIMVGVGGQGIILASEIVSEAALEAGHDVRKSEVHGMAQRGGSVSSHVRFGPKVLSPLIELGGADIMLAFEKAEGLRACDFLRDGGRIVMDDREIVPITVSTGVSTYPEGVEPRLRELGFALTIVDAAKLATEAGNPRTANVVLLAALAGMLDIDREIWPAVIRRRVPERFLEVNLRAFDLGYEAVRPESDSAHT